MLQSKINNLVLVVLFFVMSISTVLADYEIEVKEYLINDICRADISVTIEGDAGPYTVQLFDESMSLIKELDNLYSDVHVIHGLLEAPNMSMIITDFFGCEFLYEELDFDCQCVIAHPDVEIQHIECQVDPGIISISPFLGLKYSVSVVWQDDPNNTSLIREDLAPGQYCGDFLVQPFGIGDFSGGALGGAIISNPLIGGLESPGLENCEYELCFDIEDCFCDDYEVKATIKHVSVVSIDDGEISLSLENGQEPITYEWEYLDTGELLSGNPIQNLSKGFYRVTITDSSCKLEPQIEVYEVIEECYLSVGGEISKVESPTDCNDANGYIMEIYRPIYDNLTIESSSDNLIWTWTDLQTFQVLPEFTKVIDGQIVERGIINLSPGYYKLDISGDDGCIQHIIYELFEPENDLQIIPQSTIVLPNCGDIQVGEITARVNSFQNYQEGFNFEWSTGFTEVVVTGTPNAQSLISDLGPGIYNITITSLTNMCSIEQMFEVIEEEGVPIDDVHVEVLQTACNGGNNGKVTKSVIGGTPPFNYSWSTGLGGLPPGNHQLTVTDHCGNTFVESFSIPNCNLEVSYQITNPLVGQSDGQILIFSEDDCGNDITVNWLLGVGNHENPLQDLSSGRYVCEVVNAQGCREYLEFYLEPCHSNTNPMFDIIVKNYYCNGTIEIELDAQLDNYDYQIIKNDNTLTSEGTVSRDENDELIISATGQEDGAYELKVRSSGSCDFVSAYNWSFDGCENCEERPIKLRIDEVCGTVDFHLDFNELQVDDKPEAYIEFDKNNEVFQRFDYLVNWVSPSEIFGNEKTYISNGEKIFGEDRINIPIDESTGNYTVTIHVYNITTGCVYQAEWQVGPKKQVCAQYTRWRTPEGPPGDLCIAGYYKREFCGQFEQKENLQNFNQFKYYPFDKDNPCSGGGIIEVSCPVMDFNFNEYLSLHPSGYFAVNPNTPHSQYDSYIPWENGTGNKYFTCDGTMCVFNLFEKDFPLVVEYCGQPEVEKTIDPDCSSSGIVYTLPIVNDDGTKGCQVNVYCLEPFTTPPSEPSLISTISAEYTDCCVNETHDENGNPICKEICNCDLAVGTGTDVRIVDCNEDLNFCSNFRGTVLEDDVDCDDKFTFEFTIPEDGRVNFYYVGVHESINCDNFNLESAMANQSDKFFSSGTHKHKIDLDERISDTRNGKYLGVIEFNGEYVCDEFIINDYCEYEKFAPTGCNTDLASSNHNDNNFIPFASSFTYGKTPAVITGPLSYNGADPATVRVHDISSDGFDLQLEEWDYSDGAHASENVSFFYSEPGVYDFGGLKGEVGFIENVTNQYKTVEFNTTFSSTPVVVTTVVSNNDPMTVSRRVRNITDSGFQMKLQEQTGQNVSLAHAPERIAYIAIEQGEGYMNGKRLVVGNTGNSVRHTWATLNFDESFDEPPLVIADMQTVNGGDLAVIRYKNLSGSSVQFKVEEERSADNEINHGFEEVGYILIESDGTCDCSDDSINLQDTQFFNGHCNTPNGSISVSPEGSFPFTFEWSNGETTSQLNDLPAGEYFVTVTDANGCTAQRAFDIDVSPRLGLYSNVDHPDCDIDNGAISLFPYGGVEPYTYNWESGSTTSNLTSLSKGEHKVTVTDVNGCWVRETFYLRDLNLSEYEIGNSVCGQDNGSILGQPHSGRAPFTYAWDNGATTRELRDLAAGMYRLTVTDALGCTDAKSFNVQNENSLNFNASGGDEGFSDGKFLEAGTQLNWSFIPYQVADQLVITSSVQGDLVNTGAITDASSCACNDNNTCNCAYIYMGDFPGQSISLPVGSGTVSAGVSDCDFGPGFEKATMLSGQITLTQSGYISIDVSGSVCGSVGTGWILDITCDQSTNRTIDPELIETMARLEADNNLYDEQDTSIGLRDVNSNLIDFNIYPNPAKNTVVLKMLESSLPYDFRLFDINGRVVMDSKNISDAIYTFNVSDLAKGLYMVDVISQNKRNVKRLIVN